MIEDSFQLIFERLKKFPEIQLVYQIASQIGTSAYLVGGTLRDAMMGLFSGKDFDFVIGTGWQDVARSFAEKTGGKLIPWHQNQIRTILGKGNDHITVDFSPLQGKNIINDLKNRDFTINSMAVELERLYCGQCPDIIDPLGGREHLEKEIIKADGTVSFEQDPVRILRGVHFARKFNFHIDAETRKLIRQKAALLSKAATERIKKELFMILALPGAELAIQELINLDILYFLVPEAKQFARIYQGAPHQSNLLEHSLYTVSYLESFMAQPEKISGRHTEAIEGYLNKSLEEAVTRRSLLIFAGFLHDSGKVSTRTMQGEKVRFLGHEKKGVPINVAICKRLRLGRHSQRLIGTVTRHHMRILQMANLDHITQRAKLRLVKDADDAVVEILFLAMADVMATSTAAEYKQTRNRVQGLVEEIIEHYFSPSRRSSLKAESVSGREVMKIMGIAEGRQVGEILKEIHEGERRGIFTTKREVIEWLKKRA